MFNAVSLALSLAASPLLVHAGEEGIYTAKLRAEALAADARFSGSKCEAAQVSSINREAVTIADRPDVAAARETVRVVGCGRSNIENVSVARLNGETSWAMASGLPGESLAEMSLQNIAFPQVIAKVAPSAPTGCTTATLDEVYVAARPGKVKFTNLIATPPVSSPKFTVSLPEELRAQQSAIDPAAAWVEVWPLVLCGRSRMSAVVFVPEREHRRSYFFVIPIWPQIEAHGAGAKPAKD